MEKIRRTLTIWYYAAFVLAVLVATLGYFCITRQWFLVKPNTSANVAIYTCIILYVIVTTPLVLKYFGRFSDKIRLLSDEDEKIRRYSRLAKTRLAIVTFGLLISLFFYYVLQQNSLLWLAGISAIALYFCKPTQIKIDADLNGPDNPQP